MKGGITTKTGKKILALRTYSILNIFYDITRNIMCGLFLLFGNTTSSSKNKSLPNAVIFISSTLFIIV